MPTLLFTVAPPGVAQLHDLLSCLAKFDENVSIEATTHNLRLSALNLSKTAHASCTLDSTGFFVKYHFDSGNRNANAPKSWSCKVQNRALLAIFRRRLAEPRDKDLALERCEFELVTLPDQTECRLVFKLVCRYGIVKTYKLFYETGEILHASFDQSISTNFWTISARTLSEVIEYFGPKTELLDWKVQGGKVTFTSYTEKIQNGKEILRQPMQTSVALERKDFDDFNVQEGMHIGITVKDFRSIVAHAEAMKAHVTARYSRGNRPMLVSYSDNGMLTEFTLMTRGTSANLPDATTSQRSTRNLSVQPIPQHSRTPRSSATNTAAPITTEMQPPAPRTSLRDTSVQPSLSKSNSRESPPAPSASLNPSSFFIPADNDDQQWDEPNYEEEPDIVTWDNTSEFVNTSTSMRRIRDSESESFASVPENRTRVFHEIQPTQRLSQVKGLFD